MEPEDLLDGHPVALSVYKKVRSCLVDLGPLEVRTTKSQTHATAGCSRKDAWFMQPLRGGGHGRGPWLRTSWPCRRGVSRALWR